MIKNAVPERLLKDGGKGRGTTLLRPLLAEGALWGRLNDPGAVMGAPSAVRRFIALRAAPGPCSALGAASLFSCRDSLLRSGRTYSSHPCLLVPIFGQIQQKLYSKCKILSRKTGSFLAWVRPPGICPAICRRHSDRPTGRRPPPSRSRSSSTYSPGRSGLPADTKRAPAAGSRRPPR